MKKHRVVTCFLEHDDKILILKRSGSVGSYQGKWGAVAGYIEKCESADDAALKEIKEETGIENAELVVRGEPFEFTDRELGVVWVVHPYRFRVKTNQVCISWEHVEWKWIRPEELRFHDTVPKLTESWERVSKSTRENR
jgi:8-oxo-dGTP pyrophosphatase MutT (NUDIX family)